MISLTPSNGVSNSYSVNWKSQESHILEGLRNLVGQDGIILTDVTLACEGEYVQAHKLVLSLCSPFFKDLFQRNRADKSNTIVILGNVSAKNLRYILRYMYHGKVDIPRKHVDSFLEAGSLLKIEGLVGHVRDKESDEDEEYIPEAPGPSKSRPGPTSTTNRQVTPASMGSSRRKRRRTRKKSDLDSDEEALVTQFTDQNQGDGIEVVNEVNESRLVNVKTEQATANPVSGNEEEDQFFDSGNEGNINFNFQPNPQMRVAYSSNIQPRRKTSVVWKYFIPNATRTRAKCKLCKKRTVLATKGGSTSTLLRHLQGTHPGSVSVQPMRKYYCSEFQSGSGFDDGDDESNSFDAPNHPT